MALGRAVRNERQDLARIKFRRPKQQPIVPKCPRSLKGEQTYGSSMNLAGPR